MVRILGGPDTDEKGELDELEETMCCLRLLKRECKGTVCLSVWIDLYTGLILSGPQSRYLSKKKGTAAASVLYARNERNFSTSCAFFAQFMRDSYAIH